MDFCDELYRLEREFKHLPPSKRRKRRQNRSKPIVEAFLKWVEESPFYGNSGIGKATAYKLKLADGLRAFLNDGRIEMDNNPTENAICLSMAEDRKRKWCGFLSKFGKITNGVTKSGYPSNARNIKSVHALVENDPSNMCKNIK